MKMGKLGIRHLLFRCRKDVLYVLPCVVGLVYWGSYFFFGNRLPGARYVLGVTRVISFWIVLVLIDRLHRHDGFLVMSENEGKKLYSLDVHIPIDEIEEREIVRFKVQDERLAK